MKSILLGCVCWAALLLTIYALRPKSLLHTKQLFSGGMTERILIIAVCAAVILAAILPMGLAPKWNGTIPDHRNQYELITESFLKGQLHFDYEVDPALLAMENPYDKAERVKLGVDFHWDHAFYNGHYYMYFGVVPVFLAFMPYRILTGQNLTTYHATQYFAALFIIGLFMLFRRIAKRYFPNMSLGLYLTLSAAFAVTSIWYSIDAPAMYCTAITAGLCLEIWSLYFFSLVIWEKSQTSKQIVYAAIGGLLGALAFGCRPPVALANLLLVPLLIDYWKTNGIVKKTVIPVCAALIPYAVVGALIMVYNYLRFDSPFEFGQTYQLTIRDQTQYSSLSSVNWKDLIKNSVKLLFDTNKPTAAFPFLVYNGVLISFPIFLTGFLAPISKRVRNTLQQERLSPFILTLMFSILLVTVMDVMWTPWILERYRMDIYWLFALLTFISIGVCYRSAKKPAVFSSVFCYLALITLATCVLLVLVPNDSNYTEYYPGTLGRIVKALTFGLIQP